MNKYISIDISIDIYIYLYISISLRKTMHRDKAFKMHSCFAVERPSDSELLSEMYCGTILVSHGAPGSCGRCRVGG